MSPGGTRIAVFTSDGSLEVWEAETSSIGAVQFCQESSLKPSAVQSCAWLAGLRPELAVADPSG